MVSVDRLKEKLRAYRKVFKQNWDLFRASKIGIVGIVIVLFFVGMAAITPFLGLRDPISWRAPDADIIGVTSWWDIGRNVSATYWYAEDAPINRTISFRVKQAPGATEVDRLYFTAGNKLYALTPSSGSFWDWKLNQTDPSRYDFAHITNSSFSTDVVVANFGDQYNDQGVDYIFGVGTYDGYIYIVEDYPESDPPADKPDLPSGESLYIEQLDSAIISTALYSNPWPGRDPIERFYFGTAGGYLYAYSVIKLDNEDWNYDHANSTWVLRPLMEEEIKPSPRTDFSMAYDSINDKMVLFGGYDGLVNDETWIYDPSTGLWEKIALTWKPSARYGHSMTFDSGTGKVILFGGMTDEYGRTTNDTWLYDVGLSNWTQVSTTTNPSARAYSSMTYDSDGGFILLFGGSSGGNETWKFDTGAWLDVTPATTPSPRYGHAMAYDSASQRTVLFGGSGGNETWIYYSGNNTWWNSTTLVAPSSRKHHAITYDIASDLIVLFGGDNGWDETWTFNATNQWNQQTPASRPDGRYGHSMVYDSHRNVSHIFGGDDHKFSRLWYKQLSEGNPIIMAGFPLNDATDPNRSPCLNKDGSVIFLNDGSIRAVRTNNITDAWNPAYIPTGANVTNPPIVGLESQIGPDYVEAVYFTSNDGWIYARYASNGTALEQWEEIGEVHPHSGVKGGLRAKITALEFDDGALTMPDIRDEYIYFGSTSGHLYAIRRDSTEELPAGSTVWVYSDRKFLEEGFHFTGGVRRPGGSTLIFAVGYTDGLTPKDPSDDIGYIISVGEDGSLSWRQAIEGYIGGTPSIWKDNMGSHPTPTVWFGTSFSVAHAFSSTGENKAPLAPGCYDSGNCYTLGTDAQGRDIFSQLMWGSQIALTVGLLAAAGSIGIGTIIGLVAGYSGGRIDAVLMRFTDVILVLPGLPFLIILAAVLGPSYWNIIFVLTIIGWPGTARVIRSEVLSLKERPFIDSARVTGASNVRIMFKHLAPNVMPLAFLYMTLAVSGSILSEAALSFLGLGDVNTPSWGQMLQAVQTENVLAAWWWLLPPGLAITFISLAFYLIGRAFEQIVNPRLRKR